MKKPVQNVVYLAQLSMLQNQSINHVSIAEKLPSYLIENLQIQYLYQTNIAQNSFLESRSGIGSNAGNLFKVIFKRLRRRILGQ
ncbi:hypothetical protein A3194_12280 [Candidatus Thiodiazotropha endoloripes]|nr:hypothetical protein A3194_12280 [Candidatus Thiodiazotropha endoloripes]